MTLAMARLLVGYEAHASRPHRRFGAERAVMALVTSLFHDAGYIREFDDRQHRNGAEFTLYHVTRSARFLARFLPSVGMESWVPMSHAHRAFHRLRNQARARFSSRTPATASSATCWAPPT